MKLKNIGLLIVLTGCFVAGISEEIKAQAINGLRRVVTPDQDLLVSVHSQSSIRAGFQFNTDTWPLSHASDTFAVAQPGTGIKNRYGRAQNRISHTMFAVPSETPNGGSQLGPPSSLVQLDSQGLVQGEGRVFSKPTGGPSAIEAFSYSDVDVQGSFNVVVDPNPVFCSRTLYLDVTIDMMYSGFPHGVLNDGARFYKKVGDNSIEATYSVLADGWFIVGSMTDLGNRPRRIQDFQAGQDMVVRENGMQLVVCGENICVEEHTSFDVGVGGNDGDGPQSDIMQFPNYNHGSAFLKLF